MIVISDSSVVVSALISPNGSIAGIFKEKSKLQFTAPSFLFEEIEKHYSKIAKVSPLNNKELKAQVAFYKSRIKIIDVLEIPEKHLQTAFKIVAGVDFNDIYFVALNRYKGYKIWTLDKKLINGVEAKGYKIFVTVNDLKKGLYKKRN